MAKSKNVNVTAEEIKKEWESLIVKYNKAKTLHDYKLLFIDIIQFSMNTFPLFYEFNKNDGDQLKLMLDEFKRMNNNMLENDKDFLALYIKYANKLNQQTKGKLKLDSLVSMLVSNTKDHYYKTLLSIIFDVQTTAQLYNRINIFEQSKTEQPIVEQNTPVVENSNITNEHSFESAISLIARKASISEIKDSFLKIMQQEMSLYQSTPELENELNEIKAKIAEIERSDPSDFKDSFAYLAFILRIFDSLSDPLRDKYYEGMCSCSINQQEPKTNPDKELLIELYTDFEKLLTRQVNFTGKIQTYTTFVRSVFDKFINNVDVLNDIMVQGFNLSAASNDIAKEIMLKTKKLHDYLNIK